MVIFPQVILDMPEGSDRDYMEWLYREYCALMFSTAWKYFRDKADVVSSFQTSIPISPQALSRERP